MQKENQNKKASKGIVYAVVSIAVIIVIFALNASKPMEYKMPVTDMHASILKSEHMIKPSELYKKLNDKNEFYQVIDLRTPHLFNMFHIEGSVNIPADIILSKEAKEVLEAEGKKVLVCANTIKASEVYMLLTQYGYKDLFVMEGGVSYWKYGQQNIKNGTDSLAIDEKPWYDYAAVIKQVSGSKGVAPKKNTTPVIQVKRKKKKTAGGGCG